MLAITQSQVFFDKIARIENSFIPFIPFILRIWLLQLGFLVFQNPNFRFLDSAITTDKGGYFLVSSSIALRAFRALG